MVRPIIGVTMGHSSATKLGDIKAISFVIVMVKKGIFWSTEGWPLLQSICSRSYCYVEGVLRDKTEEIENIRGGRGRVMT